MCGGSWIWSKGKRSNHFLGTFQGMCGLTRPAAMNHGLSCFWDIFSMHQVTTPWSAISSSVPARGANLMPPTPSSLASGCNFMGPPLPGKYSSK